MPLASITKLMSGFIALDVLPATTTVTISKDDIALGSASGLVLGEKWKLKDLLNFSLINSSNDGIHAISAAIDSLYSRKTLELMNERAGNLGLKDTFFFNSTGLDIDGIVSGAYSSASDVAMLLKNILAQNPTLFDSTKYSAQKFVSESNILHVAKNTNLIINTIPGLIASKTGLTDLAGGNLAIIFDAGFSHPIIAVVLGSSEEGRFKDMELLIKTALGTFSEDNL